MCSKQNQTGVILSSSCLLAQDWLTFLETFHVIIQSLLFPTQGLVYSLSQLFRCNFLSGRGDVIWGWGILQSGPCHTLQLLWSCLVPPPPPFSVGRMDLFDQSHKESNATLNFNRHLMNFLRLCWVVLPTNPGSSLFYLEALGDEVKEEMPRGLLERIE